MGKQWKRWQTLFLGVSKIAADGDCSHEIKRCLLLVRKAMTNLDTILKSRDFSLSTKVCIVKAIVFPVLPVFTGNTDPDGEAPILWPLDAKSWLIGNDPDSGKDWSQEEKRKTEGEGDNRGWDGWHYRVNGHEFEQALGDGEIQGSLACCSPWDHKESDRIEWLNSYNNSHPYMMIFVFLSNHGNLNLDYRKIFYIMEHRIQFENNRLKTSSLGDLPSGSMAKAPHFQCRGSGFNTWSKN